MKISEFIEQLNKTKEEHGDLEVNVFDPSEEGGLDTLPARIAIYMGQDDKALGVTICDVETALSFT